MFTINVITLTLQYSTLYFIGGDMLFAYSHLKRLAIFWDTKATNISFMCLMGCVISKLWPICRNTRNEIGWKRLFRMWE